MYKLTIKKEMEKLEESLEFESGVSEKTSELELIETPENIEIKVCGKMNTEEDMTLMEELEFIFKNFKFNKDNFDVLNIHEIIEQWQIVKKENIFKRQDKKTITTIIQLTKFYDNEKSLSAIIKNYSYIPFLLFFYKYKDVEHNEEQLIIGNIFDNDAIDFKAKIEKGKEENEYILSTRVSERFDSTEYAISLIKKLNIPRSVIFSERIELSGSFIYSDRLERMKIDIKISSRDVMNYTKTIELLEIEKVDELDEIMEITEIEEE